MHKQRFWTGIGAASLCVIGVLFWHDATAQAPPTAASLTAKNKAGDQLKSKIENKQAFNPRAIPRNQAIKRLRHEFRFHPVETPFDYQLAFNPNTLVLNTSQLTVNYTETEQHGTRGSISHDIVISAVDGDPKKGYKLFDDVELKIDPKRNADMADNVAERTEFLDPVSFSDTHERANYAFTPAADGLQHALSLESGTAFPALYSPDGLAYGALAAGTLFSWTARVAPGVIEDPEAFWSSAAVGAIDLYHLTLSSDAEHEITATLTFGAGSADFTLDYIDHQGVAIDPAGSPASVEDIEDFIAAAFVDGVLPTTLADVLAVGFVPVGITEFTTGWASRAQVAVVEQVVPIPAAWLLLASAGAATALMSRAGTQRRSRS